MHNNDNGSDDGIKELNSLLKKLFFAHVNGNHEQERTLYEKCHSLMQSMVDKSDYKLSQLRSKQLKQLESAYKNIGTSDSTEPSEKKMKAKQTLQEMGIEVIDSLQVKLSDIAGLERVKEEIFAKIIYPLKYKDLSSEYGINFGGGILLYGPPGTGKTQIAKAIATESYATFVNVNPAVLFSEWFGKFEKNINLLFKAVRSMSPSVVFFDEVDTLLPSREETDRSDVVKRGVSEFLMEIGGMMEDEQNRIVVLAATNNPWQIDKAFLRPGRFDEKIYVGLPDEKARMLLFKNHLITKSVSVDIDFEYLSEMATGFTGAEIGYICQRARQEVFLEAIRTGVKRSVMTDDILSVINKTPRSVDRNIVERYLKFSSA